METYRGWRTFLAAGLACVAAAASCSAPSKGALILAISTDMQTPKDVDVVSVYVTTNGTPKFDFLGRVQPDGKLSLPSTLAVVEPDDPNAEVRVRVVAFQTQPGGDATARVVRDVLTTVPHGRVALLRLPLNFLDDGMAHGTLPKALVPDPAHGVSEGDTSYQPTTALPTDPGYIKSDCDFTRGMTSVAGTCQNAAIPSSSLRDYNESEVFGDGGTAQNPSCFHVDRCLAQASAVATASIKMETDGSCTFPLTPSESGQSWNCALATTNGTGACFAGKCFVPLESDPGEGFTVDPGKAVRMVPGVCKKLMAGAQLFLDKKSCATKLEASPVCEPGAAGADGGGFPSDAAAQGDGGLDSTVPPVDASSDQGAADASPIADGGLADGASLACPSDLSSLAYVDTTATTMAALPPFAEGAIRDGVYVLSSYLTYEVNGGCSGPDAGTALARASVTVSHGKFLVASQAQGQSLQCQGPYPLAISGYSVSPDGQTLTLSLGGSSCSSVSPDGAPVEAGTAITVGTYAFTGSADAGVSLGCASAAQCPGGTVCCIDRQTIETCSAACSASQMQVCASSTECASGQTCAGSGGFKTCSSGADAAGE